MDPEQEIIFKLFVIALVIYGTSLHELGHAYAATWLGDPTPGRAGRLTFNPIPHLDPLLTAVVIPFIMFMMNMGLLTMAMTPINPARFRRPMRDRALVALAGPLMNFLLAGLMLGILWIPGVAQWGDKLNWTTAILSQAAWWNLVLGVFNLLPIPPLDGYWIVRGALPLRMRMQTDALAREMTAFLLVLVLGSAMIGFLHPWLIAFYFMLLPR